MRVIFAGGGTGGHLFPGLAVAREFQRRDPTTEILFVGTKQGIEFRVLPKAGFRLETLTVRGLKGRGMRGLFDALYGVPAGVVRSLAVIKKISSRLRDWVGRLCLGPGTARCKVDRHSLRDHGAKSPARLYQ